MKTYQIDYAEFQIKDGKSLPSNVSWDSSTLNNYAYDEKYQPPVGSTVNILPEGCELYNVSKGLRLKYDIDITRPNIGTDILIPPMEITLMHDISDTRIDVVLQKHQNNEWVSLEDNATIPYTECNKNESGSITSGVPQFRFYLTYTYNNDNTSINKNHFPDTIYLGDSLVPPIWNSGGFNGDFIYNIPIGRSVSSGKKYIPKMYENPEVGKEYGEFKYENFILLTITKFKLRVVNGSSAYEVNKIGTTTIEPQSSDGSKWWSSFYELFQDPGQGQPKNILVSKPFYITRPEADKTESTKITFQSTLFNKISDNALSISVSNLPTITEKSFTILPSQEGAELPYLTDFSFVVYPTYEDYKNDNDIKTLYRKAYNDGGVEYRMSQIDDLIDDLKRIEIYDCKHLVVGIKTLYFTTYGTDSATEKKINKDSPKSAKNAYTANISFNGTAFSITFNDANFSTGPGYNSVSVIISPNNLTHHTATGIQNFCRIIDMPTDYTPTNFQFGFSIPKEFIQYKNITLDYTEPVESGWSPKFVFTRSHEWLSSYYKTETHKPLQLISKYLVTPFIKENMSDDEIRAQIKMMYKYQDNYKTFYVQRIETVDNGNEPIVKPFDIDIEKLKGENNLHFFPYKYGMIIVPIYTWGASSKYGYDSEKKTNYILNPNILGLK